MRRDIEKFKIAGVILFMTVGLMIMFYPAISNYFAEKNYSKAIQEYNITVEQLTAEEIERQFILAETYHEMYLNAGITDPFSQSSSDLMPEDYASVLNVNGIMGYIEIPTIDVYLPIYHSTSDEVLKKGVGHLASSAFPIGKTGGHSVLTAHRGLPSAKLFTDLNLLEIKDLFYIHVLDRTFAYEVDQITVIEPYDTDNLQPMAERDYVTLLTCTPYAINSHRLLVRGKGIEIGNDFSPEGENNPLEQRTFIGRMSRFIWPLVIVTALIILGMIIAGVKKMQLKKGR